MKILIKVLPAIILVTPFIASAEVPNTFRDLVEMLVELLNTATGVLVAAALVAFLYGAAYNMLKAGERGSGALRQFLVWGVIILFVMVSIWGILNLLQQTLFGSGANSGSANSLGGQSSQNVNTGNSGSNITFE